MYISVKDRPRAGRRDGDRSKVAPVVITLGFVSLLTDISSESVSAILPLYLVTVVGLSPASYGFVDGLYQGVSALVRIAGGWAADRGGHPKWVAFIGYGLSLVARLGLLFATGFATITAAITADRLGKGIRTAPRDALIASATPTAHLGRAFGVHRTLDTVGAALGPLIAFGILWAIPSGYTMVLVVSLAFALLGVLLLGLLVSDRPASVETATPSVAGQRFQWRMIADPRLTKLLVIAGLLGLLTIGDGFMYLSLLDRGEFATHWFPMLYVGTNISYLALALPLGRLADRLGRTRVFVAGHVFLLLAYVCADVDISGAAITLATLLFLGAFYAATDGVLAAAAGRLVAPEVRASGIAAAQTVVAVARFVSSSAFGLLWFGIGRGPALATIAIALAAAIAVAGLLSLRLDRTADAR